jgi:hypothetical protein
VVILKYLLEMDGKDIFNHESTKEKKRERIHFSCFPVFVVDYSARLKDFSKADRSHRIQVGRPWGQWEG